MGKKIAFYLITFTLVLLVLEAIGYVSFFLTDDIYDHRNETQNKVDENELADLKGKGLDPLLGWKYYGPMTVLDCNCQDLEVEYTFDQFGARVYSGYEGEGAEILVVGDSYTHGTEVRADDTFSAQLAEILNVSVANQAVGGYGPVQAFLNLKEKMHRYPKAKVVILGIMYENIFRMVNSYRPVLAHKSSPYRFKPYIQQGNIMPHPGEKTFKDVGSLEEQANRAFDDDFWAKPKHEFPFSVSFIRALASNYSYFKKLFRKLRKIGVPEYFIAYRSDDFSRELVSLLDQYATFAEQKNVRPVVVFLPRDKNDTKSVARFIERNRRLFHRDLLVADMGSAEMDWEKYNLLNASDSNNIKTCHPSPYAHKRIAEVLARLLQRENAWPPRAGLQVVPGQIGKVSREPIK
jgi:hypothetical protein